MINEIKAQLKEFGEGVIIISVVFLLAFMSAHIVHKFEQYHEAD